MERKVNQRQTRGYITISVAMVLVLSISLCLTLIEGCRRSTVMLVAECAIDTGMNSILAEYHRELLKQYGLFFIDTSYGTAVPDYGVTMEHLQDYVEANLSDQEPILEFISEDFLDLHWDEGEIIGLSVSSDEDGAVLRRQISEYMYDHLGVSYVTELLDWLDIVEFYDLTGDWYSDMRQSVEKDLSEWMVSAEEETKREELSFLDELLKDIQERTLNLLLGLGELSDEDITGEIYLSQRELLEGTGLNPALEFSDGMTDSLLLNEYILLKTGYFGKVKAGGQLAYQTEYILCGLESDIANISEISDRLFAVRAAADVVHILGDQEKMDLLETVSELLATAVGVPEIKVLVQTLFVLIWAAAEALWDVEQLFAGGKVPLIKNELQWHYDIGASGQKVAAAGEGLNYADYLRIFLAFEDKQIKTYRLMDVMEMDIRRTLGNENFHMDGCVDSVTVCIDLESGYGYQFYVTRNYGY